MPEVTLTPAAERILTAAEKLFYDNGIHAVGVDLIAAVAGVTKKTLYDRFGSKDALVTLYLRRRDERWRTHVLATLEAAPRMKPARRPLLVFDALESWNAGNSRGCAFVNAQAELPDPGHPARPVIVAQKRWLLDIFAELAGDAGLPKPKRLAESLLILFEGALVAGSAGVLPTAIARARDTAGLLIERG
ncbi:TetR/AcrR family transcriptional regulator [Amycolatopsis australiensis]|uniref:DNA-binding transcriptional regulator, AcrR family n=1 Tax=Amycolatopsis australiensis TaxID=546364 RepID=A0A1K1SSE4_9PSEU|nr:TetR/AcrR family transcriptional regulator [Amycolatopsis australiensis]SFW86797.1 DNA-binding transcriptional regulator, AcrR family [Amycolatopsis australiensis]